MTYMTFVTLLRRVCFLVSNLVKSAGHSCHGGTKSTQRVVVNFACIVNGSDELLSLVAGKSKSPRCFKNVKKAVHKIWC
jgi:hypothetical protein